MDHLREDARRAVEGFRPVETGQVEVRRGVLELLDRRTDACRRSCEVGHITVGIVVLDPDGRVLLTLHPKFGRWLQLGGHLEPGDPSIIAAAAREAAEESGIEGLALRPSIIDIDIHAVPCPRPGGAHHDLRFLAVAPAGAAAVRSAESLELGWFADLPPDTDESVARAVRAARATWRAGTEERG